MLNVYVIYVCPISHLRLIYNGFNTPYYAIILPLLMKKEINSKEEKMLKFIQFCNF